MAQTQYRHAMPAKSRATGRQRGRIEELPSGSLRVKIYAGTDPVSGKRHDLTEVIPAGPKAQRAAQRR
jgi:integrase